MLINQEFIDYLLGSCTLLYDACEDFDIDEDALTNEDFQFLDSEIYNCPDCGWWVEVSDTVEGSFGEDVCSDCAGDS